MAEGDLIYDSATGQLVYNAANGQLVYKGKGAPRVLVNLSSSLGGISVTHSDSPDYNGDTTPATTPTSRTWARSVFPVTLRAPASFSGSNFRRWEDESGTLVNWNREYDQSEPGANEITRVAQFHDPINVTFTGNLHVAQGDTYFNGGTYELKCSWSGGGTNWYASWYYTSIVDGIERKITLIMGKSDKPMVYLWLKVTANDYLQVRYDGGAEDVYDPEVSYAYQGFSKGAYAATNNVTGVSAAWA